MKNIRIRKESVAQRVEAIRKTVVFAGVFLTALFLIGSLNGNTAKAASRKCYSICTGNTRVYSNTGLSRGIGWIYDSDQISVINVTRNWSQVSYFKRKNKDRLYCNKCDLNGNRWKYLYIQRKV